MSYRAWHIEGRHPPAPPNGGYLTAPLSICSSRPYTLTLYARLVTAAPPGHMSCHFSVSSLLYGVIGSSTGPFTDTFSVFGPWEYVPDVGAISIGPGGEGTGREGSRAQSDGSWNDTLSIWFGCEARDAPFNVLAEVDTVMIV